MAPAHPISAFNQEWNFGFNKDTKNPVLNLTDGARTAIFYTAGHTGIIYDYVKKEQKLLSGHINKITTAALSSDRRWIVTADSGQKDSTIIVWDSLKGTPVKTIFDPHGGCGVLALDLSADSKYIVTISASYLPQQIAIWDWLSERNDPLRECIVEEKEFQHCVKFNPYNPLEIITNGKRTVNFVVWDIENEIGIQRHIPLLNTKDFHHSPAEYTVSCFLPLETDPEMVDPVTDQAVEKNSAASLDPTEAILGHAATASVDGNVVIWSDRSLDNLFVPLEPKGLKAAIKFVKLHNTTIYSLQVFPSSLVVSAAEDGFIRVHDIQFRLVAWFEKEKRGPITHISFRSSTLANGQKAPVVSQSFKAPEFVFSTSNGKIYQCVPTMDPIMPLKSHLLVEAQPSKTNTMTAHPFEPLLAIAGEARTIHIRNYKDKSIVYQRQFEEEHLGIMSLEYSSDGKYLAIGFSTGHIRFLYAHDLSEVEFTTSSTSSEGSRVKNATFHCSNHEVQMLKFSPDSRYLAAADRGCRVSLFEFEAKGCMPNEWCCVGSYKSHNSSIVGMEYFLHEGKWNLMSVSQDRFLVKYDLHASSVATGLLIKDRKRIEQIAMPTSVCWPSAKQDLLLCATNEYKLKLINIDSHNTRKTTLAPVLGGPITEMKIIKCTNEKMNGKYLVYRTDQKQIGLIKLPLDGNPNRSMAILSHSDEVVRFDMSFDGQYVFTIGRNDYSFAMWSIDPAPLDAQFAFGGEGYTPFLNMLPGGPSGPFMKEIEDYFYYAQIKSQGEDVTAPRIINDKVSIDQVPALMHALGYFPSEREVDDLVREIKYDHVKEDGELVEAVTLNDVVKLYVNHRPLVDIDSSGIAVALQALFINPVDLNEVTETFSAAKFKEFVQMYGEALNEQEWKQIMKTLLEDQQELRSELPKHFTADDFINDVLGFEQVSQDELNIQQELTA